MDAEERNKMKEYLTKEQTDKLFNVITSNGCREMEEDRFYQAVNEAIEISIPMQAVVKVNFAEEEKIILQSLLRLKILEVQDEIDRDIFLTLDQEFFCEIKIKKLQELLSKISA